MTRMGLRDGWVNVESIRTDPISPPNRRRRVWGLTATAILLLSLDDMISIHERLEGFGLTMGGGSGFCTLLGLSPV